ncbi:hypothetical protein CUC00_11565 [Prevotella intermedia]|nr:hypothetical protein CUC00_11565 [Prevotella intermedia]
MQPEQVSHIDYIVVFTFQTESRCNTIHSEMKRKGVVFTFQTAGRCNDIDVMLIMNVLFLPFKQQADATKT